MEQVKKNKFIDNLETLDNDMENYEQSFDDYENDIDEFEQEEKLYNLSVEIHYQIMKYVEYNNLPLCEYLFENHIKSFLERYI